MPWKCFHIICSNTSFGSVWLSKEEKTKSYQCHKHSFIVNSQYSLTDAYKRFISNWKIFMISTHFFFLFEDLYRRKMWLIERARNYWFVNWNILVMGKVFGKKKNNWNALLFIFWDRCEIRATKLSFLQAIISLWFLSYHVDDDLHFTQPY